MEISCNFIALKYKELLWSPKTKLRKCSVWQMISASFWYDDGKVYAKTVQEKISSCSDDIKEGVHAYHDFFKTPGIVAWYISILKRHVSICPICRLKLFHTAVLWNWKEKLPFLLLDKYMGIRFVGNTPLCVYEIGEYTTERYSKAWLKEENISWIGLQFQVASDFN